MTTAPADGQEARDLPVAAGPVPLRAIVAWALGACFFAYGFMHRVAPSVMVDELMRDFAVGAAILGHLSAFYFYAYAGLQIPIGIMMDRFGPRRLMAAAAALVGVGSLVFATGGTLPAAYAGRLLIGAGAAFSWVGTLALATMWFPPQRFALLVGAGQFVGMAGAVLAQAPLGLAVERFGWRPTLLAGAGLGAMLALLIWLVARDRPAVHQHGTGARSLTAGLRAAARNPQTWFAAVFGMAMTGPMLAFAGLWGVPYMVTVFGLDRAIAAATMSLMFVGWGIGAPILGGLSDRMLRRKPLMLAGSATAALSLLAVLFAPGLPLWGAAALLTLHGAGASTMVLGFACTREHNPPWASGAAYGVVNTAVVSSGALFQPLIGMLLDWNWSGGVISGVRTYSPEAYQVSLLALPIGCAVGFLAAACVRETFCRQQDG